MTRYSEDGLIDWLEALGMPENGKFILRTNHMPNGVKLIF